MLLGDKRVSKSHICEPSARNVLKSRPFFFVFFVSHSLFHNLPFSINVMDQHPFLTSAWVLAAGIIPLVSAILSLFLLFLQLIGLSIQMPSIYFTLPVPVSYYSKRHKVKKNWCILIISVGALTTRVTINVYFLTTLHVDGYVRSISIRPHTTVKQKEGETELSRCKLKQYTLE
jgi:hypothetical protein